MTEDTTNTNEQSDQDELVASEDLMAAEDVYPTVDEAAMAQAAIAGDSLIAPFIAGTGEPAEAEE